MAPKYKFQEGEKVLCFHGPLIYEAKCLKAEYCKESCKNKYYIHYAGWNKNWDEWVPEDRVLKLTDANLLKQKDTLNAHDTKRTKKVAQKVGRRSEGGQEKEKDSDSRASTPVALLERTPSRASKSGSTLTPTSISDSPLEVPRRKRGRIEPSDDIEEPQYSIKTTIQINIPDELKCHLIDENEIITKQKKLPSLPMSITIDKVFKDYVEAVESGKVTGINKETAVEVSKGIKEYFNVSINSKLLYGCERPLFEEMVPEDSDVTPSSLYGPYYLLRLFVKLGNMLSYSSFDEKSTQLLLKHFKHFLQYLKNNSSTLFSLQDYNNSLSDYSKKFSK